MPKWIFKLIDVCCCCCAFPSYLLIILISSCRRSSCCCCLLCKVIPVWMSCPCSQGSWTVLGGSLGSTQKWSEHWEFQSMPLLWKPNNATRCSIDWFGLLRPTSVNQHLTNKNKTTPTEDIDDSSAPSNPAWVQPCNKNAFKSIFRLKEQTPRFFF